MQLISKEIYKRVHGDKQEVTITKIDDGYVYISDCNGTHFINEVDFHEENFTKIVK